MKNPPNLLILILAWLAPDKVTISFTMKTVAVVVLLQVVGLALAVPHGRGNKTVIPEPKQGCQYSHAFTGAGQQAYIQSPNWPGQYPKNSNCMYSLTSPPGTQIKMDCSELNIEYTNGCAYDRMTISLSGNPTLQDGMGLCGQGTFTRTTTANALVVGFKSDGSNPYSTGLFRFQCLLTVVGAATGFPGGQNPSPGGSFNDNSCSCGTRNEATRIVGGVGASAHEIPWRVAMYSPNYGVFCSGTVISRNWVLTAAHCIKELKGAPLFADVGDHDLSTTSEAYNEVIKCDRVIQHALYDNNTQDNDVALCHLETPLTYSRTIQPACLPWTMTGESFQGKSVTASGWGTTSSGGSPSLVLRKVDLPVLTTEECRRIYPGAITDNMICTYSPGRDTCQGDSGGSIDYRDPYSNRYVSIGVVSWGVGCAAVNQPGVYAKVTRYLNWIETNTAGEQFCR